VVLGTNPFEGSKKWLNQTVINSRSAAKLSVIDADPLRKKSCLQLTVYFEKFQKLTVESMNCFVPLLKIHALEIESQSQLTAEILVRLDPLSCGMLLAIQSLNYIQTGRVSIRKVVRAPRQTSSGTPRGIFTE
jgi:hypothetical protein